MRQVVKRVSLTQPAPIQVDSTEPEVIKLALEQIPGRAIVNSINLEAGEDKADVVVPLAVEHGAALIALTIEDRKSTRLNSSHANISYAVFCLKKKRKYTVYRLL